jgi:hypothetical protein
MKDIFFIKFDDQMTIIFNWDFFAAITTLKF